jgi:hypothetical protein
MRVLFLLATLPLAFTVEGAAQATAPVPSVAQVLADLRTTVAALPKELQSERLHQAVDWLANQPSRPGFTAADISIEYTQSLLAAAGLLRQLPLREVVDDVTADLEAKVEHCRALGVSMGGRVTVRVNTIRAAAPVSNWRVNALPKLYERVQGTTPRQFLRVSTPTEMALEPGRYWVWAHDPTTGQTSERVLVRVAGAQSLQLDLVIP